MRDISRSHHANLFQMSQALDAFGRPLRDLRISVTDRCNFRCTYCMPKEVFGHDYRFLDRKELLDFDEITRVARAAVGARRAEDPAHRRRAARPPRHRAADRDARRARRRADADDQRVAAAAQGAGARRTPGLDRITVSLDAMDDATFRAMNDVDFPVERVLEGIEAARAVGLPVKVNCVVKRGVNEHQIVPMARYFRETGDTLRFIEFMDVGATNGWRMDDVVPAAEIVATVDAEFPLEPADAQLPRRGRQALALPRRQGRDRHHRLGHAAVLRRLHALAHLGRGQALHLPVRGARPRPARADPQRRDRRGARARGSPRSGSVRGDRYSELRSEATEPRRRPARRDVATSAAEPRNERG